MVTTIMTNSSRNQFLNFYFCNTLNKYKLLRKESYKRFTGNSGGHHSIVVLCLCPHCTHRLQPPEVSFHRNLKNYECLEGTNLLRCQPGWTIRHYQVAGWSAQAHAKAATNYIGADKSLARLDWKNNWKFTIFRPTRRSLLPRRPGWTENLPHFFLSDLQKLEFGRCSFFPNFSG